MRTPLQLPADNTVRACRPADAWPLVASLIRSTTPTMKIRLRWYPLHSRVQRSKANTQHMACNVHVPHGASSFSFNDICRWVWRAHALVMLACIKYVLADVRHVRIDSTMSLCAAWSDVVNVLHACRAMNGVDEHDASARRIRVTDANCAARGRYSTTCASHSSTGRPCGACPQREGAAQA